MPTLDSFLHHPIETLEKALHIRKQIELLNQTLKGFFGHAPTSSAGAPKTVGKRRGRPAKAQSVAAVASVADDGVAAVKTKNKRKMSSETKAKMAAAQQKRWAKTKASESPTPAAAPVKTAPVTKAKKKKGIMSAEGRARIVAAQKLRWAKVKVGKFSPAPDKAASVAKARKRKVKS
jgi:hypothetical protein